ncbi:MULTISPECIES: hypothetical protein [Arthrobacter]|uniref:hypothetical protein n=1 Tax=Arthrobacter TaxID=1663 RepID=UPI0010576D50|nr:MULTISPECIES: hypothetical protein [Arthrobacter]
MGIQATGRLFRAWNREAEEDHSRSVQDCPGGGKGGVTIDVHLSGQRVGVDRVEVAAVVRRLPGHVALTSPLVQGLLSGFGR